MSGQKPILFYSSVCQFSRELINLIIKKDLKQSFIFISVDANKNRIPPQIDRVPALLLPSTGNVLFEDDIMNFINPPEADIMPLDNLSSAYSDNFSFLGEDEPNLAARNFALFGNEQRIECPDEEGVSKTDNMKQLDGIKNQRDNDVKSIFNDDRRVIG